MSHSINVTLEELNTGKNITLRAEVTYEEPFVKKVTEGPPENWHPEEGGNIEWEFSEIVNDDEGFVKSLLNDGTTEDDVLDLASNICSASDIKHIETKLEEGGGDTSFEIDLMRVSDSSVENKFAHEAIAKHVDMKKFIPMAGVYEEFDSPEEIQASEDYYPCIKVALAAYAGNKAGFRDKADAIAAPYIIADLKSQVDYLSTSKNKLFNEHMSALIEKRELKQQVSELQEQLHSAGFELSDVESFRSGVAEQRAEEGGKPSVVNERKLG